MKPVTKLPVNVIAALAGVALFAAQAHATAENHANSQGAAVQLAHMSQGESPSGGTGFGMMGPGMQNPGMMMTPGMQGQGTMGPGMMTGPGMMGQGMYAPRMMGPGMMMGSGMWGQGQMGPGMMMNPYMMRYMSSMMHGGGRRDGFFMPISPVQHLSVDDVRYTLDRRLERNGNKRLKLGEVKAADDDTIVADIVTVDGSLVDRLEVDRHSGVVRRAE